MTNTLCISYNKFVIIINIMIDTSGDEIIIDVAIRHEFPGSDLGVKTAEYSKL